MNDDYQLCIGQTQGCSPNYVQAILRERDELRAQVQMLKQQLAEAWSRLNGHPSEARLNPNAPVFVPGR